MYYVYDSTSDSNFKEFLERTEEIVCPGCIGCDKVKQPGQCPIKCDKYRELLEKVIKVIKDE